MAQFVSAMLASFPEAIAVPKPLRQYFEWIEALGLDRNFDGDGYKYANTDPATEDSCLAIVPVDPEQGKAWLDTDDPAIYSRLAAFCATGGDGSRAALWLDDDNIVQIVHLGSGSGSILVGVMAPNAVDFLRLLAIGYDELCWDEHHALTPEEACLIEHPDIDDYDEEELEEVCRPAEPVALRQWLAETFTVDVPATADAIIPKLPSLGDDHSDDPFWQWVRRISG
jgi:hypothetical protein